MNWINSVANNLIKDWAKKEGITYEQESVYIYVLIAVKKWVSVTLSAIIAGLSWR